MSKVVTDILRDPVTQKSGRRVSRILSMVLSTVLAASILALPATKALADGQVLELPQVANAPSESAPVVRRRHVAPPPTQMADAPMPAGMGTLQDYEHQDDSTAQNSSSPSSFAIGGSNGAVGVDPNGNRDALIGDAILGAVAIGLFALEVHQARRHY